MDTRVKPEYDDFTGGAANLQRLRRAVQRGDLQSQSGPKPELVGLPSSSFDSHSTSVGR
jgi:hypothetical protein